MKIKEVIKTICIWIFSIGFVAVMAISIALLIKWNPIHPNHSVEDVKINEYHFKN